MRVRAGEKSESSHLATLRHATGSAHRLAPGDERVFQRIALQTDQRGPVQAELRHRPLQFMRAVDPFHALVVGGQERRHAGGAIHRERLRRAVHAEDLGIAGEVDLHRDPPVGHVARQARRIGLVHHVDAMPDASRMPDLHRLPDMEPQRIGRHQAECQFAGMQRDLARGIAPCSQPTMRMCSA